MDGIRFRRLFRRVVRRLEQADRGDRGWFLITRVHLSPARLRDIATYLYDVGASAGSELGAADYDALAMAAGVGGPNPGVTLRRHHLLAMEKPLNLLRRVDSRHWRWVQLTGQGVELATVPNASAVLEQALLDIEFCREPWYRRSRVRKYQEFSVRPYRVTLEVMARCDGWVDRDEYDLFLSRIRVPREILWAIDGIREFRQQNTADRTAILQEVRRRVPGAKAYLNWRDMGPHTFSLLSLGTSAVRMDHRLYLTARLVEERPPARPRIARPRREIGLRIPTPPAAQDLGVPPAVPAANPGTEGELLVGKLMQASGWETVFYTNRRGFGFDIWARREGSAIVVEVKSSLGELGPITLTHLEYEAAQHYGPNYVLATVENVGGEAPIIRLIQDPARALRIEERNTVEYRIPREIWAAAAAPPDLYEHH